MGNALIISEPLKSTSVMSPINVPHNTAKMTHKQGSCSGLMRPLYT